MKRTPIDHGLERTYLSSARMATGVRLAAGLLPLIQVLNEHRVPFDSILEAATIPRFALDEPSYRITLEQELKFTRMALNDLGIAHAGLLVGERYHISALALLGLAASTAPTALDVFHIPLTYPVLTWGMFDTATWRDETYGYLTMEPEVDLGWSEPFFAVRDMACALTLLRDALGTHVVPDRVTFTHPAPANTKPYSRFFGCNVRFGQAGHETRYPLAVWEEPLPQANDALHHFFVTQCRRVSEALVGTLDYADVVRARLQAATPLPTLSELASALHLTERTLQRRLSEEGTSFSEIRQEVRRARALEYLRRKDLSIEAIAERLGYSDTVAFSHAFKSWTGSSPRAFRQRQVGL